MRSLLRRIALATLITPAAAGLMMTATPAEAATTKTTVQTLQAEISRLTNIQRTTHGCPALTTNTALTNAARAHSAWMAQTGAFSHTGRGGSTFVSREKTAGYTRPSAENIAWGYRSATDVVNNWMKSPGHRANILNCKSRTVGVGAVYSAGGNPYYTQDFGY